MYYMYVAYAFETGIKGSYMSRNIMYYVTYTVCGKYYGYG